ncbi:MAG: N-acetyltransferase [Hyphomicrobiales bacterium]
MNSDLPLVLRPEQPGDEPLIDAVIRAAFGQDVESSLVEALRRDGDLALSLVAERGERLVGHIAFSRVAIVNGPRSTEAVSLAPLAVLPSVQHGGIGSALVEEGLRRVARSGARLAFVIGYPSFYRGFGFAVEPARPFRSPWSKAPGCAHMVRALVPGGLDGLAGAVRYPPAFSKAPGSGQPMHHAHAPLSAQHRV